MPFEIENVAVEVQRQGAAAKYPLADLNVGQSFVVPFEKPSKTNDAGVKETADEAKDRQLSTLRGAVQNVQNKFAEVSSTETKKNRKGEDVPVKTLTRKYAIQSEKSGYRIGRTA